LEHSSTTKQIIGTPQHNKGTPSTTTSSVIASALFNRLVSFFERKNPSPSIFLLESICFLNYFSLSRDSVFMHLWFPFAGQAEQEDHH
jgi:hypothetical protein